MVGTRPAKTRRDTTVGTILTRARHARGLSVAAVAAELNIPSKHLQSLEDGDLSVFSAEVYARGAFLKYADFLGVRAEKTQHTFLQILSGAREYVPLRVHRPQPWLVSMLTPRWILAGAIASIALVVGTYIALQVQSFLELPDLALREPVTGVSDGASLTIRGVAESHARVTVNGQPALLDTAGNFTVPLVLHPGINVVHVEAENAAGRKRIIQRDILMPRTYH
ncbi:MAG: helix-turn-helix domain-containing protein [Candidatus Andersenbacteria bacterium]